MGKFKPETRTCKNSNCGNTFLSVRKHHYYCEPKCRVDDWREKHGIEDIQQLARKVRKLEKQLEELEGKDG